MTEAHARLNDPSTSHEAADSVDVTDLEARVLTALKLECPQGATTHELAALLGASLVSISPRMKPLRVKGLVMDSGVKRRGPSGRYQTVWKHT